ncbi:hypothetical protein [Neobacillus vireti]|nr:hypothetical protein [Neobacillus vireti]
MKNILLTLSILIVILGSAFVIPKAFAKDTGKTTTNDTEKITAKDLKTII